MLKLIKQTLQSIQMGLVKDAGAHTGKKLNRNGMLVRQQNLLSEIIKVLSQLRDKDVVVTTEPRKVFHQFYVSK